jgi:hypothetical protein
MEIWKPIKDYDKYSVSSFGRIKRDEKILKLHTYDNGYKFCFLYCNGIVKKFKVARIVAINFIPNPENKPQVDHINRDRSNDSVLNLRWATHSENNLNKNVAKNNKLQELNIRHRPEKNLPYIFQKKIQGVETSKSFKTLEEAVEHRRILS